MKTLIIFLILINSTFAFAQIYEKWVIRYNGPLNARDEATAIKSDQSGNVFVTGYSANLNGNMDYVTQKYNACGHLKWSNIYNWGSDFAIDIGIDGSGNVFATGFLSGGFGNDMFGTLKYNPDGNNLWVRHLFGPVPLSYNTPKKMFVDDAGNSFITGTTSQFGDLDVWDVMTAKYNSSGVLQWQKYYNGPGNDDDIPEDIYVDSQGNSYVTGGSFGNGTDFDFFILKYSAGGTLLNVVRYNGEANGSDGAYSVYLDELGNIYITGQSQEYENPVEGSDGQNTFTTIKYNSSFNLLWVNKYYGIGNPRYASGRSVKVLNSNEIYVSGYARESGNSHDFVTRKINAGGGQTWIAKYNGPGNYDDVMKSFTIDNSGNAYVTGESKTGPLEDSKDYATVKYNISGTQQWAIRYNGTDNNEDVPSSISYSGNNVVYVTGKSKGINTDFDYATIKYSNDWSACQVEDNPGNKYNDLQILSNNTSFIAGNNGKIKSSYDKGLHWNNMESGINSDIRKIKFINANLGIALGDSVILKTTNGGLDWRNLQFQSMHLKDIFILNDRTSLISCSNGKILKSNDLWNSYSIQNTNLSENIVKVNYSDSLKGTCISENGRVLKTINGGNTWSNLSALNFNRVNNAFFKNSNEIIVVGDNGKIILTSNGGISWHNRNINRNVRLNSVYLDTDNKLFVCGDNGLILFSSNFGISWEDQPTGTVSSINEIGFFDSNSGAAITEDGQVLLTSLGTLEAGTQNSNIPLTTGVYDHNQQINQSYDLYQNFPNPFNPVTQINFTIPEKLFVSLKVYDVLGKEVKTLINGELEKGKHSVSFNGSELSSGIYIYKITAGSYIHQRQMLLMK